MVDGRERFDADLAAVAREASYVVKQGKNDFHGYKYARAEDVFRKVNEGLSTRGISISSSVELLHYGTRETGPEKNRKSTQYAVVRTALKLTRGDHSAIVCGVGEGADSGDKSIAKATTAATKYALSTGFLISWGDDAEADTSVDRAVAGEEPEEKPKRGRAKKETAPGPEVELLARMDTVSDRATLEQIKKDILAAKESLKPEDAKALVVRWNQLNQTIPVGGANGAATA